MDDPLDDLPGPRRKKPPKPIRERGQDPEFLLTQIEAQGLELRQRKVARLERQGLPVEEIALELSKTNPEFTLEQVLNLRGEGPGKYEDLKILRQKYQAVLEEVTQKDLLDAEREFVEFGTWCISVAKSFITGHLSECPTCGRQTPSKEAADMALKWSRSLGVGLGEVNKTVVEHRYPPAVVELFRKIAETPSPQGEHLKSLLKSEKFGVDDEETSPN